MLQQDAPQDFVIATGVAHSVREFVEKAFAHVGVTIAWRGVGIDEQGVEVRSGAVLVKIDPEVRSNLYQVDVEATMLLLTRSI